MKIPHRTSSTSTNAVTRSRLREEEKRIIAELTTTSLSEIYKRESLYFVISKRWFTSWKRYVDQPRGGGRGAPRPGPIDNNDIIDTRRLLVEDEDYLLVPQRVWNTLLEWYNGGPPIPRILVNLYLSDARDVHNVTNIRLEKQATIRELYDKVCAKKGISYEKAHIWDYFNMKKGQVLEVSNQSIEELGLHMTQDILLEVDGSSEANDGSSEANDELSVVPLEGEPSRLAGLVNMGNTCYMNSALQCLAHTPPIREYFLQDQTKDELAKAFGELLKELWYSGSNAVSPRVFKTKLDKAAPQFSGHIQHDSHELLTSLLVSLREVSDIVNVCQGQCKSILSCPVCGKTASTDESFTCLSLPLPSTLNRSITVTVFYVDGSPLPISYTVTVPRSGSCSDLIAALSTACSLTDDESLLLAMVYENKIFGYLENPMESLSVIKDDVSIVACLMNQMQKEAGKAKLEMLRGGQKKRPSLSGEKTRQEEVITLYACLEKYLAEEPLGLDNMWSCPECKEERQANKKYDLWKLPEILMFQLIRFKSSKYFTKKIDTFVDFPVKKLLELSKYVNNGKWESYLYELYAVINHLGGIGGVGHYTTYAKLVDDDNNKWYHYDDSIVKPVNESEIKSSAAYVLCYRRVGSESAEEVSKTDDMDQS